MPKSLEDQDSLTSLTLYVQSFRGDALASLSSRRGIYTAMQAKQDTFHHQRRCRVVVVSRVTLASVRRCIRQKTMGSNSDHSAYTSKRYHQPSVFQCSHCNQHDFTQRIRCSRDSIPSFLLRYATRIQKRHVSDEEQKEPEKKNVTHFHYSNL